MKKAIYPGSFDPVTYGHLDIIRRASEIFDEITVSVLNNQGKRPLFSVIERVNILQEVTKDLPNVRVDSFDGLLVDHAIKSGADVVIRGLRAITDFEYELQLAQTNRKLWGHQQRLPTAVALAGPHARSSQLPGLRAVEAPGRSPGRRSHSVTYTRT